MKICKKLLLSAAVLLAVVGLSATVALAADSSIVISGGKAYVGDGRDGVAVVASYDKNGKFLKAVSKPVENGGIARLDVSDGDKVMFWDSLATMNPLSASVTVKTAASADIDVAYEKAVQNALYEALGKNKGEGMTELQKAVALHDWLVENCQYDVTTLRTYTHTAYGAIVEGFAVCDGYTYAYNDLLGRVGIKGEYVRGRKPANVGGEPQPHAWSCVTLGGKNYFVDVSADDPIPDTPGKVSRARFLVSDRVLNNAGYVDYTTHCTEKSYENHEMFNGYYMRFMWDDDKNAFYYIDLDKVKTTTDFSEKLTPSSNENGAKPSSMVMTDDKKFMSFFRPSFVTSESTVYLYSFETDKYYTYELKDITNVIFCRVRLKDDNIEVVRDYYKNDTPIEVSVKATLPLPKSIAERRVVFDENYSGAGSKSCEYLDDYWKKGDGSFDAPTRDNFDFAGWYTKKLGGEKVESFGGISGDNATLYAHWWGAWKITENPTKSEPGKAVRSIEGDAGTVEEITIPDLSDTSVWTKKYTKPASPSSEGEELYTSKYGNVVIKLPKTDYEYGFTYENGTVYVTVTEEAWYFIQYESGGITGERKMLSNGPGKYPTVYPKNFTPSGKVKVTLLDADRNEICSYEYTV